MKRWATVIVVCSLHAGCAAPKQESEPIRDERTSAPATVVRPQSADGLALLEAPARVITSPSAAAVVSSLLEARVLRVRVEPGQTVAENEPLLDVLMPDVLRAAGELSSASLRLGIYEARHAKLSQLVEQGLARAAELAELEQNRVLARADQQAARATLRTASIGDKQAESLLSSDGSITLRAPMAGIVTAVSVRPGEVRAPSSGAFVEIATLAPPRIEARFASAPPASASLDWIGPDGKSKVEIAAMAPQAGATDGARLVWFRIAEGEPAPVAGTFGRVRIVPAADWVVVPTAALVMDEAQLSVRVRRGEGAQARPVKLILRGNSEAVITGVTTQDELVLPARDAQGAAQ